MSKPGRKSWHNRVINALMKLGVEYGYEPSTGIVYYKIGKNRFEYHPDVLWLYNSNSRFKPSAFVWEVESRWVDLKKIAGDTILGYMMKPEHTSFFKQKEETSFGRTLKKNETILNYYGEKRAMYYRDYHKKMNLNATHLFLVMEFPGCEDYWQRYCHSIAEHIGFGGEFDVVSVPRSCDSIDDVRHRLAHLKLIRNTV